jgi:hypothetical protein
MVHLVVSDVAHVDRLWSAWLAWRIFLAACWPCNVNLHLRCLEYHLIDYETKPLWRSYTVVQLYNVIHGLLVIISKLPKIGNTNTQLLNHSNWPFRPIPWPAYASQSWLPAGAARWVWPPMHWSRVKSFQFIVVPWLPCSVGGIVMHSAA